MQLSGIGVCAGRALGPVAAMATRPTGPPPPTMVADPAAECRRLAAAVSAVAAALRRRAAAAGTGAEGAGTAAEVLQMAAMIAEDPTWSGAAVRLIEQDGMAAAGAFWQAAEQFRAALAGAGGYFAERVRDIDDIRDRVLAELAGAPPPGVPFILIAHDLAPADTATLRPDAVLALVTEEGGPTSHTAILARALGIPAVVACVGITAVPDGTLLAVDADTGEVRVAPTDTAGFVPTQRAAATVDFAGRLADGTAVELLANVGNPDGARQARQLGAGGIGLLRTEFLFGDRSTAPTLDEQVSAYSAVFRHFPDDRVVVRTLDAGADKPLPFLPAAPEANPALGLRGLRLMRAEPQVLDTQLAAIARAADDSGTQVWTMAPMIATPAEAAEFVERARGHGLGPVGVMVEIPSAAILADELLRVVDFVSIGTNDLAQYTFAADRMTGALAGLNDPWQPALLRLIEGVAAAGLRHSKPVGVCGEAAADPLLAMVLAGLGVTSLSATSRTLPAVAQRLRTANAPLCARLAQLALSAPDTATARRTVAAEAEACQLVRSVA